MRASAKHQKIAASHRVATGCPAARRVAESARSAQRNSPPPEPIIDVPFSFIPPPGGHACPCSGQCGASSHATSGDTTDGSSSVPGVQATAFTDASHRSEPSTDGTPPKDGSKVLRNRRACVSRAMLCTLPEVPVVPSMTVAAGLGGGGGAAGWRRGRVEEEGEEEEKGKARDAEGMAAIVIRRSRGRRR